MINAICNELTLKSQWYRNEIKTIYLGGGTPSLLSDSDLHKIFNSIISNYYVVKDAEISIEVNPDDVNDDFISTMKSFPINRISLGVQSFFEPDLIYMNRAHSANEGRKALTRCIEAGFRNISVDLIYGTPTLSNENWIKNIDICISLDVPHLSCYQLTVEDKTPLAAFISRQEMIAPDENLCVQQFHILLDKMDVAGYEAYEISNYAKPGFRSRHNSSYWLGNSYIGIGPSAHSYVNNMRSWNTVVNSRYVSEIKQNKIPENREILNQQDLYNEFVLIRLRTMEGIHVPDICDRFPAYIDHFNSAINSLIEKQLLFEDMGNIRLTRNGKIWADAISAELMM